MSRARPYAFALALALAFVAGRATRAQDEDKAAKEKKVRELLTLNGTADLARQQHAEVLENFRKAPNIPKRFVELFKQDTKPDDLFDLMVGIWGKVVDDETVDATIAFYKTPAGKKLAEAQPKLSKALNDAVATWGLETMSKILRKMGDEEEAAKKKAAEGGDKPKGDEKK